MKAVILAGGKGTRLAPYTTVFPKPMLPIGERPILDLIIRQLARAGFSQITLSVGYLSELIEAYFRTSKSLPAGVDISYVREDVPLGTAGSLSLLPPSSTPLLVLNGDTLTTLDYSELLKSHVASGAMVTIASHRRTVAIDFGVLQVDGEGRLEGYDEKPVLEYSVSMGVYVLEPAAVERIRPGEQLDFPDLVRRLMADGEVVQTLETDEFWLDIGRHGDYEEALRVFPEMESRLLGRERSS